MVHLEEKDDMQKILLMLCIAVLFMTLLSAPRFASAGHASIIARIDCRGVWLIEFSWGAQGGPVGDPVNLDCSNQAGRNVSLPVPDDGATPPNHADELEMFITGGASGSTGFADANCHLGKTFNLAKTHPYESYYLCSADQGNGGYLLMRFSAK